MKNSIITFSLLASVILGSSFTTKNPETKVILQKSFAVEKLHTYFDKDESGELLPLNIVTNDYFSSNMPLAFDGKEMNLVRSQDDLQTSDNEAFVNITKFKIKRHTAILKFKYKTKKMKIKLRKHEGEWIYQTLVVKGDGKLYADTNIEF